MKTEYVKGTMVGAVDTGVFINTLPEGCMVTELQVRPRPGRRAGESPFRGGGWQEQKRRSEAGKEPANRCGR